MDKNPRNDQNFIAPFLIDATTIIDYQNADRLDVLELLARECGPVLISELTPRADAKEFTVDDSERLGFEILEVPANYIVLAQSSPLGLYDECNLLLAQKWDLTLITSDKPLWKAAIKRRLRHIRQLAVMRGLISRKSLSAREACRVTTEIVGRNSRLDDRVFLEFCQSISQVCDPCSKKERIIQKLKYIKSGKSPPINQFQNKKPLRGPGERVS